jgi:phosphatidylserine decarboxylase
MQLEHATNLGQTPVKSFEELFECDPAAPHHGFASWDAFFTRRVRFSAGIRPVAAPGDDSVVANPCESTPYRVATGARAHERFWVKGRAYSVHDMLAHDERAPAFVGGTVYQAVLSALAYHRWHAPVSGIVRAARVIPGLYFSAPPFDEFVHAPQGSTCVESTSLEYLSAVATRALLLIEADNPKIGLMAFLAVGIVRIQVYLWSLLDTESSYPRPISRLAR